MTDTAKPPDARRPLATRQAGWARTLAAALTRSTITPNQISVLSILFAAIGAWMLYCYPNVWGLLVAAACIQLRLLCNLLDGMVAVEGGKLSPVGALYNEIPDRLADSLFLVAAGYATPWPLLGWFAALAAAITAYIRVLGGALGQAQDFRGPMAKQHRMFALTLGCLAGSADLHLQGSTLLPGMVLVIIAVGTAATCVTRTVAIARRLRAGPAP